jgi:hypothetical protein
VKDRLMVAHDEVNGRWELRLSIICYELEHMGCLVPMR